MLKQLIKRLDYHRLLEWVLARPKPIILAAVLVTVLFGLQIPRLSFKTSVYDLQIENLDETVRYGKFKELFGSDEIIRVVIKADQVFDAATFAKVAEIAAATKKIEGVRRVVSLPGIKEAVDVAGSWSLDKFVGVVSNVQLFEKNIFSADRKTTALTLVLKTDADMDTVIGAVEKIIAESAGDVRLYQIGMPLVSQALARLTQKDFLRLPPLTALIIGVVLLLLFRRWRYLFIPVVCVGLSLVWTFGLMALSGIPLSMLTMIVPVFLIAVGTAYCLHIVSEYITQAAKAETSLEAARATFGYIYFPTSLAVVTTVIGLVSLLLNRIPTIREFAVFACFGMLSLLVLVQTFLPAALSLMRLPNKEKEKQSERRDFVRPIIERIIDWNLNRQKVVLPIIAVFVLFCLVGITRMRVETNPVGYFKQGTAVKQNFDDIYQVLSGSFPVNVVMAHPQADYFEDPANLTGVTRLQQFLETLPGVDKTISFADYMKLVNYALNQFDPTYYALPEEGFEVRMVMNNYSTMLGQDMYDRFMSSDLSKANIVLLTHIASSREFLALREKVMAHVAENFSKDLQWEVTGFGISIAASSHQMTAGQVKSLSFTMVLVFGIMFLLFLSFKVGLIAIVPNMFPIAINFGIMGWLGIELSMVTSLIASVAIGLAVDDTIHYLVRYNREFQKDLDDRRALRDTLLHVGRPIIFTTITISLGFAILIFSSFKPTAVFGIMMVITMLAALVGDLIVLPSLMQHVELVTLWDLVRLKLGKEPAEGIPLFQDLSRAEIRSIIMAGSLVTLESGKTLFNKGDPSDAMYTIVSGSMEVLDPLDDDDQCQLFGSRRVLNRIYTGEVIGEMGLLRSAPRSATVVAMEPVELLRINWKMIQRLQWLYPPTAQKFMFNLMRTICDRLEHISTCLADAKTWDDSTGLCNRNSFVSILEKEIDRSRRYDTAMTVCVMDLRLDAGQTEPDYHQGEQAFVTLSRFLLTNIRKSDILSRIDLHRFALLMPQVAAAEAEAICSRLVEVVRQASNDEGLQLSIVYGLCQLPSEGEDCAEDLIDRAVVALQAACN